MEWKLYIQIITIFQSTSRSNKWRNCRLCERKIHKRRCVARKRKAMSNESLNIEFFANINFYFYFLHLVHKKRGQVILLHNETSRHERKRERERAIIESSLLVLWVMRPLQLHSDLMKFVSCLKKIWTSLIILSFFFNSFSLL
jgi:hypothetical protein